MKKLLFILLTLLMPPPTQAATISFQNYLAAINSMQDVVASSGTWTDPTDPSRTEPVLFVKFTADYGPLFGVWHTCTITWINEFMAVIRDRTLAQALAAKTTHGYRVDWNDTYKPAPANIHPWCLQ